MSQLPTPHRAAMARLLRPQSVAIVGVSDGRSMGRIVLTNLQRFAYTGQLHLVSRSLSEMDGLPCVPDLAQVPDGVDVAVLAIPAAGMLPAVQMCARKGFGAVVVFASGYAETGPEGRRQQEALAQVARDAGMLLVGPNSMGLTHYAAGVPLTFEGVQPLPMPTGPGIGIVSQSGAMANNMRDAYTSRGLRVTCSIGSGNEADLGIEDYLAFLLADPDTAVVSVYAEQIRHPQRFLQLARQARQAHKPVVLLMPGKSARAQAAALSHTGAIVSNHASACALLAHEAVLVVETLDELLDTSAFLARFPRPASGGVAFVTNSGAVKNIALDVADALQLDMPPLAPETVTRLQALLPDYAVAENPLDYTTATVKDPALMSRLLAVLDEDPNVGSVVLAAMAGTPRSQQDKKDHLLPALTALRKPAALVILGDRLVLEPFFAQAIVDSRLPMYRSTDRCLRAVARVHAYGQALARASRAAQVEVPSMEWPRQAGALPEYLGKALLRQVGLATPRGELARDLAQACALAQSLGYPVVLKAQAADLLHKSDVGGVIVGVRDEAALREAWARLQRDVAAARPDLSLDGVLVETMGAPGLELVIGAKRDPHWGPVLMVGLGGIWIETLHDVRLIPPDMHPEDIIEECRSLKAAALLAGARGQAGVDLAAVADAVSRVGALMRAQPRILEIDINPLLARADGVNALDALIVLDEEAA